MARQNLRKAGSYLPFSFFLFPFSFFLFPSPFYVSDYVKSQAHNNASLTGLEQVVSGYS
jgi:hypothetical protein